MKNYRFGFDIWGLVLFVLVMIPNFIWFAVPAPNDVLRNESVTPTADALGSVFQVLSIGCLCVVINKERSKLKISPFIISSLCSIAIYFLGWILYYIGYVNPFVILCLTIPPCLSFIFFDLDRKNMPAFVFAVCFTVCHSIYGTVNFIF